MPLNLDDTISYQLTMAKKVIKHDVINKKIEYICGADVSYRNDKAFACAIVMDKNFDVIDSAYSISKVEHPYVPGLLFLRESEPILDALKKLEHDYDVLMIDGHGVLHPRRFGLACYVGMQTDKPTIGIGKSLLCGTVKNNTVLLNGKVAGHILKKNKRPIYVSIGHKISLKTAVKLVKEVSKYRIPEPLRLADINSHKMILKH